MSANQIALYRFGLRLAQAQFLLSEPSDAPGKQPVENAAVDRLAAALERIDENLRLSLPCVRIQTLIAELFSSMGNLSSFQRNTSLGRLTSELGHMRSHWAASNASSLTGDDRKWFVLGMEVINGCDQYSEGQMYLASPKPKPRGRKNSTEPIYRYARLATDVNTRIPHQWTLTNHERVFTLLQELNITWHDVFPDVPSETSLEGVFSDLQPNLSWAWTKIECGMTGLAEGPTIPVWHGNIGELKLRSDTICKLNRSATNLRKILDAFEDAGWPRRIANPLDGSPKKPGGESQDPDRQLDLGMAALNRKIKEGCIHFAADGSGGVRWDRR